MLTSMRFLLSVSVLLLIGDKNPLTAKTLAPQKAIEVTYTHVTSFSPLPQVGDTIYLTVKFKPNYTGPAKFHLHFPGQVVPIDCQPSETMRDSLFTVDSGGIYTDSIALELRDSGHSLVSFSLEVDPSWAGAPLLKMFPYAEDYIQIKHSSSNFQVRYSSDPSTDIEVISFENRAQGSATIDISGKVLYGSGFELGVSRTYVEAVFLRHGVTGGPGSQWSLPMDYVYETRVDMDGNFHLVATGPENWTPYDKIVLLVKHENDAARLQTSDNLTLSFWVQNPSQEVLRLEVFPLAQGLELAVNDPMVITYSGLKIFVNPRDGAILRNMELSQKFCEARGIIIPGIFNVHKVILDPDYAGFFYRDSRIEISDLWTDLATCAHEWGHYYTYLAFEEDGGDMDNSSTSFIEGFAEFFQFAVRNWVADNFADHIVWSLNNQEEAPFDNERFKGVRYASTLGRQLAPIAAEFSCYLWNMYDKYTETDFKSSRYQGFDNDDVGISELVFDAVEAGGPLGTAEFTSRICNMIGADLSNSEAYIYGSMVYNDVLMRPAQIRNLTGHVDGMPINPPSPGYRLYLNWSSQAYLTGNFVNPATGIHIYQSNGSGGWNLLETIPATTTSYFNDDIDEDGPFEFKVSTYNSSGDAYGAPEIEPQVVYKIASNSSSDLVTSKSTCSLSSSPNPFISETNILLSVSSGAFGQIEIFDLLGRKCFARSFSHTAAGEVRFSFEASTFMPQRYLCTAKVHFADGTYKEQKVSLLGSH